MREPASAIDANAMAAPPQALLERLKDYGQEDAFAFWNELSPDERDLLIKDIEVVSIANWLPIMSYIQRIGWFWNFDLLG